MQSRTVLPGRRIGTVRTQDGVELEVPADWELLAPGDAALTRSVKQAGPTWTVQVRRGRKTFSRGVWAPSVTIAEVKARLQSKRESPSYQQKLARDRANRQRKEAAYQVDFAKAVLAFLRFAPTHHELAVKMSRAVAEHACPVGSGTVARTKRIPIEERAEAAVIAWMRHETSAYDDMVIARQKGARREVRRKIAQRSRRLLDAYRRNEVVDLESCPLFLAVTHA
jgi:hypothetical protein